MATCMPQLPLPVILADRFDMRAEEIPNIFGTQKNRLERRPISCAEQSLKQVFDPVKPGFYGAVGHDYIQPHPSNEINRSALSGIYGTLRAFYLTGVFLVQVSAVIQPLVLFFHFVQELVNIRAAQKQIQLLRLDRFR